MKWNVIIHVLIWIYLKNRIMSQWGERERRIGGGGERATCRKRQSITIMQNFKSQN